MTERRVRHTADTITDDELDELYAEREQMLAELDGRSDEARERWIQKQLDETGIRSADFRRGMTMDIEPAREMVAHWVGAARAMLGDAPNYTETPVEMVVKVGESPERFAFTLQRVGKLTPHEARQQAEQRAETAEASLARVRALHSPCSYPNPDGPGDITYCTGCDASTVAHPCNTLAALDQPQEPRPPAVHIGNRANAEDCPACSGTNPPYPFLCPGPNPA